MSAFNVTVFDSVDYLKGLLKMTSQEMWDAGMNLDDWDYGVVLEGYLVTCSAYLMPTKKEEYPLHRLLNGVCDNEWFEVTSKDGKKYTIGMAYHS